MTLTSPRILTATLALLLACGGDGGTSTTDSDTSAGGSSSTGAPATASGESSSGEPTTAGSVSESAEGSSTGAGSSTGDPGGSSTTAVSAGSSTGDTGDTSGSTGGSTGDTTGSTGDTTSGDGSTGEPGSSTSGAIDDCLAWQSAFEAEVLEIRGCDMDSECGQELQGTSCGCTRNWVARKDADVAEFWALVDKAGELGCDLPFFSTCDCPATDGFACEAGICTWNYT